MVVMSYTDPLPYQNASEKLSKADLILLSSAREHLSQAWLSTVIVRDINPCIQSNTSCAGIQKAQILVPEGISNYLHDPIVGFLVAIHHTIELNKTLNVVCKPCVNEKVLVFMKERTEIWSKLDQWLQLER